MTTLVLVDRDALAQLLTRAWDMFVCLADESGYAECDLLAGSELVTLACQAGLPIPGPLAPGEVPPPPTASTYRERDDNRLRCCADGKVVFLSEQSAREAAERITNDRQPMKWYRGPCGHHHVSRIKGGLRTRR